MSDMINLSGITFLPESVTEAVRDMKIDIGHPVVIRFENELPAALDDDFNVIHFATQLHIGWIPKLKTLKKYLGERFKAQDQPGHRRQEMRYKITEKIRNQIVLNENTNEIQTVGRIADLMFKDVIGINRDRLGVLCAVSVVIE